jgi:hypothetical protein
MAYFWMASRCRLALLSWAVLANSPGGEFHSVSAGSKWVWMAPTAILFWSPPIAIPGAPAVSSGGSRCRSPVRRLAGYPVPTTPALVSSPKQEAGRQHRLVRDLTVRRPPSRVRGDRADRIIFPGPHGRTPTLLRPSTVASRSASPGNCCWADRATICRALPASMRHCAKCSKARRVRGPRCGCKN